MSQRKVGRVVKFRLNPRDCMSAIDCAEKLGFTKVSGISFAQVVSLAFASAMESFRRNKIIPDRDGFEFSQMMNRFPDYKHSRSRALDITQQIDLGSRELGIPPVVDLPSSLKEDEARLEALVSKSETDPLGMSDEEKSEMVLLVAKLKPQLTLGEPTR